MLERNALEVGIQLLRQYHGDGGVDALPHLDLRHHQSDHPLAVNPDERVGLKALRGGIPRGAVPQRKIEPQQQGTARRRPCLEHSSARRIHKRAPPGLFNEAHELDPAACLIALRMRT